MTLKTCLTVMLVGLAQGCTPAPVVEAAPAAVNAAVTRVEDLSLICMVTNRYLGLPQIPTEVDSRTYYGCCDMCAGRLRTQPALRNASDPVTGRPVDKAKAVAGRLADGRVEYFESAQTLARYGSTRE